ncbi:MAG TPA: hypothetical protein VFG63_04915 [Nocardioidaceae bacterium]|nr:hypothetical protein [Nocardioidaceae bacterium]
MPDPATPGDAGSGSRATLTVGAGLVLLGISASVFLILAARAVGPSAFSGIAVLWTLVYTVGIGLFLPFEQEVARALAHRGSRGEGGRPVIVRASQLAFALLALSTVLGLAISPMLVGWLGGSWTNALALFIACAALAGQYVARGVYSGSGRFMPYAVQIGTEGAVRLVACAALILAGVSNPIPYALLLAVSPLVSLVVTAGPLRRLASARGPRASLAEISVNLGWLLGASLAAQGLANLGTLAVTVLSTQAEEAAAGHFLAGFTIARSPLFLFAAVQAVLLPGLTRHLAHGRHGSFHRQLRLIITVVSGLGSLGVLGALLLGPEVLTLLFGQEFEMPRRDLTLLAVSSAIYMVALALQPAVIALAEHRGNAMSWMIGLAVFGLALLLPASTFLRVELALIAGAVAVTTSLAAFLARGVKGLSPIPAETDPATYRLGME